MTELSKRSVAHGTRQTFAGIILLTFLLSGGLALGAKNDPDPPQAQVPTTGMKSGQLTAKHDNSAEISGQAYAFHPKIAFANEEGNPLEWKEFKRGDHVQYHLKGEHVDFLVLILPK